MGITPEQLAKAGTEHAHQTALMQWCALNRRTYPGLELLFAIPNGGERNKVVAARLVAEGVRAGVPDLFLPVPVRYFDNLHWTGLFIEMKKPGREREKNGGCSTDQVAWIIDLREQGYRCEVAYSWQQAAAILIHYLTGKVVTI